MSQAQEKVQQLIDKLNAKNPYIALWLGISLFLVVPSVFVLVMQLKNLSAINTKIQNGRQEVRNVKDNFQRMPQYQEELRTLSSRLDKMNLHIRLKEDDLLILENFSRIANINKIKIEQIMPDKTAFEPVLENEDGKYYSIPIVIEAKGSYHDFGRFLAQLEQEGALLRVSDMTIASKGNDYTQQSIKLTVNAVVVEKVKG